MIEKMVQRLIPVLLGSLLLLSACGQQPATGPTATPEPLPTIAPMATPAERSQVTILADGVLEAVNPPLALGATTTGRLVSIAVAAGDWVAAGDLIAEIEIPDLDTRLEQARINVANAQAALDRAEQDREDALFEAEVALQKTQVSVEQAEGQDVDSQATIAYTRLRQAQDALARAQEAYDQAWDSARDWELYMTDPTGVFPYEGPSMSKQLEQEREGTELGLQSAQDNLTLARAEYNQVIAGRESQLLDLQTLPQDLELAEFRVEQLQRDLDPSLALSLELAQLDLQTLEQQKEDAYVYAPWAGTILSVEQALGGQVGVGAPIVTLFDPTQLEFQTNNFSERDLNQIAVGQVGTVVLKAYPDDPLTARVVRIAPQASGLVGDAAAFPVILTLDPTEFELLPGMTGRVEIESQSD